MPYVLDFFCKETYFYLEDVETDVENDVDTEVLTLSPSLKFCSVPAQNLIFLMFLVLLTYPTQNLIRQCRGRGKGKMQPESPDRKTYHNISLALMRQQIRKFSINGTNQ